MISRAVTAGLTAAWATADEAYGRAGYFRAGLRAPGSGLRGRGRPRPTRHHRRGRHRVNVLVAKTAPSGVAAVLMRARLEGPREYRWARLTIEAGHGHHSPAHPQGADGKLDYYLTWSTQPVAFTELVTKAGRRWVIEEMFQSPRTSSASTRTQVRSWHGWHRHSTLTMISFALTVLAIRDDQPETEPTRRDLTTTVDQ